MEEKEYKKIVDKILPKTMTIKKLLIAFFVGGFMGILAEFLIRFYSSFGDISKVDASSLMMITLIFISSLLTGVGIFDELVTICGGGLIIPITGFSHSTTCSAMEYRKEGLVNGIGCNIFKLSGSVILYGIISAFIFGMIRYIIFGG